jgi:dephospho-CoA kinase
MVVPFQKAERLPVDAVMKERAREIKDGYLILGVTGGIASGKSAVSKMLEDLGAPLIDFDLLAREVVEPGKPAWKEIVQFFGKQVLQKDDRVDRMKLAGIVFQDGSKRKTLEKITHPHIVDAFVDQVREIRRRDPRAIIQAVVPLLFEANLRCLVHKVILVYIPREMQIERLMKRDGISRDTAQNILNAQWPIDEKVGYADFVIHNEGPLEETRKQVEEVWKELKKAQNEKCLK